jgi:hypothetical protein
MADFSSITEHPQSIEARLLKETRDVQQRLDELSFRQFTLMERQTIAAEGQALALEAIAEHLKEIRNEIGVPNYVLTAINKLPEVVEEHLLGIRSDLDGIGGAIAAARPGR